MENLANIAIFCVIAAVLIWITVSVALDKRIERCMLCSNWVETDQSYTTDCHQNVIHTACHEKKYPKLKAKQAMQCAHCVKVIDTKAGYFSSWIGGKRANFHVHCRPYLTFEKERDEKTV